MTLIEKWRALTRSQKSNMYKLHIKDWFDMKAWLRILSDDIWVGINPFEIPDKDVYFKLKDGSTDIIKFAETFKENTILFHDYKNSGIVWYFDKNFAIDIRKLSGGLSFTYSVKSAEVR